MNSNSARNRISLGQCPRITSTLVLLWGFGPQKVEDMNWKCLVRMCGNAEQRQRNIRNISVNTRVEQPILKPGSQVNQNSQICLRSFLFHFCFNLEGRLPSPPNIINRSPRNGCCRWTISSCSGRKIGRFGWFPCLPSHVFLLFNAEMVVPWPMVR